MSSESPKRDYDRANRAADNIRRIMLERGLEPNRLSAGAAVTLGSGLQEDFPRRVKDRLFISYDEIPLLEEGGSGKAPGHHHKLLIGSLDDEANFLIAAFLGRYHLYEDLTADACAFYVRVVKALGIDVLGVTNAAGILNGRRIHKGDIVMLTDIVNLTGTSSLHGPTESMWGEPFTSMKGLLTPWIITEAQEVSKKVGQRILPKGIYVQDRGTLRRYQTAAESKVYQALGWDLIGKSTAIELEVAVDCGIKDNFGVSLATNYAYGIRPDLQNDVTSDHVVSTGKKHAEKFGDFLAELIKRIMQVRERRVI